MARWYILRARVSSDISEIVDTIAANHVDAAQRFIQTLQSEFDLLVQFPGAGQRVNRPPRHLRGLRSWPVRGFRNYLILYLPTMNGVDIVRVVHGARRLGPLLREK